MTTTATTTDAKRGDALVANLVAGVLGTAAFSASYTHVVRVAEGHGQGGWVAEAIAASVELLALAAVAELRRRKSKGESVWIAIMVLLLGVSMSLAANLATAGPGPWGKLMAAWPAVSFLAVAALVESRAGGPAAAEQSPRTDDTARTGQAAEIRTGVVRPAAPAPYGTRAEPVRTHDAPRTAVRTEDARTEPVRTPQARTEPVRTEPVRTEEIRTEGARTDEARDSRTDPAPAPAAAVDQSATKQAVDAPEDAPPVQDEPEPAAVPAPAVPSPASVLTALTGRDISDSRSDSVLLAQSDSPDSLAAPTAVAEPGGWLPGASGLLLPLAYAAGAERPTLVVPGRPAPIPGPRSQAPATARTDQTRPRTAVRTEARTERGAKPRTDEAARTESPRTERPARTDVVDGMVRELRTDAGWRPDYAAMALATGYQRSFLEKCLRDARKGVAAV